MRLKLAIDMLILAELPPDAIERFLMALMASRDHGSTWLMTRSSARAHGCQSLLTAGRNF
jgi:hypothetical protein